VAIAHQEALISKLKQMRTGLVHHLLTRGLDEHGDLRDPIAHPEQFQDSPIGSIPKAWAIKACDSLCHQIVVGIVVKPAQYYVKSGVPVLRSANVRENYIHLEELVYISPDSNRLLSKSMLRAGDLVTVRTGYPGTTNVIPELLDGSNCVDLIISRPKGAINPHFLSRWVNSPFGKDQILKVQGGLAQQHFNVGEMKQLLVTQPSMDEQVSIVSMMQQVDAFIEAEENMLFKLTLTKSGLTSDLLTGRVCVPKALNLQGACS
jgi:type I restriction enzyme S subunit